MEGSGGCVIDCSHLHFQYTVASLCCQVAPLGESMLQYFGDKLRYLREQRHLTQRDLAQQLTLVRQSHIANVESNRRGPSLQFVILIASFFHVTSEYLLRDAISVEDSTAHTIDHTVLQTQMSKRFGEKLRHLRERVDMTQSELAQQLGLSAHAHISLLENGRHEPSVDLVIHVSEIFQVTTDYLIWDAISIEQ